MLTHKEMTKHIRGRLKAQRIPARVKMNEWCGRRVITVTTPSYDFQWSAEELAGIALCAKVNRLTEAQGHPIEVAHIACLIGKGQFNFEFHGPLG